MHTTQVDGVNWIAFHNSELQDDDRIKFFSSTKEVEIPYALIKEIVNKQLYNAIIRKVEQTDDLIGAIVGLLS